MEELRKEFEKETQTRLEPLEPCRDNSIKAEDIIGTKNDYIRWLESKLQRVDKRGDLTDREKDIAYEGFMIGRVYRAGGEEERPSEMLPKLYQKCLEVANSKQPEDSKYGVSPCIKCGRMCPDGQNLCSRCKDSGTDSEGEK